VLRGEAKTDGVTKAGGKEGRRGKRFNYLKKGLVS